MENNNAKGYSIAALVCGILGIVGSFIPWVCYFTFVLAILGIVFGVKGRKLAQPDQKGLATAGFCPGHHRHGDRRSGHCLHRLRRRCGRCCGNRFAELSHVDTGGGAASTGGAATPVLFWDFDFGRYLMIPSFPLLGRTFTIYPLMALVVMFVSGIYACRSAKRAGQNEDDMIVLLLVSSLGVFFLGMHLLYGLVGISQWPQLLAQIHSPPPSSR